MSKNGKWDSLEFDPPLIPTDCRPVAGNESPTLGVGTFNAEVSYAGTLRNRPGFQRFQAATISTGLVPARSWYYETLPDTNGLIYQYIIVSCFVVSTGKHAIYYNLVTTGAHALTATSNVNDSNNSVIPHLVTILKGKAYIKSFPNSGNKYGTAVFIGGASPVMQPWGLAGPTVPAAITGTCWKTTTVMQTTDNSVNVILNTGSNPSTPFKVQMGYERCTVNTVTSLGGSAYTLGTMSRGDDGTTPTKHDAGEVMLYRNWGLAADHKIDVNTGWKYSYAYKSITGQISCRAPVEDNPDKLPSDTGPFFDLCPHITVTGTADTTNVPSIVLYRTLDGGGNFLQLDTITNTGAGSISYIDNQFATGPSSSAHNDPIPDTKLQRNGFAPSEVSNLPPPAVNPPLVNGTDPVSGTVYAMTTYASRIWYLIGNRLYYSGNEEILTPTPPEESFPDTNFFQFSSQGGGLAATANALYVGCTDGIYLVTGSNLETFNVNKISDYGIYIQPGVFTSFRSMIAFNNYVGIILGSSQVAIISGTTVQPISDPISTELSKYLQLSQTGGTFTAPQLDYFADNLREYLIVGQYVGNAATQNPAAFMWAYDIKKSKMGRQDFWQPVWKTTVRAPVATQVPNIADRSGCSFFGYATTVAATNSVMLVSLTVQNMAGGWHPADDYITGGGSVTFNAFPYAFAFNSIRVPVGDHVNILRRAGIAPNFYAILYKGATFDGSSPIVPHVAFDNQRSVGGSYTAELVPRTDNSAYANPCLGDVSFVPINRVCYSARVTLDIPTADGNSLEISYIAFMFDPLGGV